MDTSQRLYKTVGWSLREGVLKLRFTNDTNRYRVLERRGHTDINLFDLPEEMAKDAAARWLASQRSTPAEVRELIRHLVVANHLEPLPEPNKPQHKSRKVSEPKVQPRRRGRPPGSKNKNQQAA